MPNLKEKGIALLGSLSGVDMKTAASTTLFTTPPNKVTRITGYCVRDTTASLAGGTSYSMTNFRQTVDLSSLTTANTDFIYIDGNNAKYTEIAGGTNVQWTVTTGATAAGTATIDVFGYQT